MSSKNPSAWQPIETAPKDGEFLLFAPGDDDYEESYRVGSQYQIEHGQGMFTHWMPLPAAPTQSEDPA